MALTGEAKKDYQREYMRRRRAGLTGKPKPPKPASEETQQAKALPTNGKRVTQMNDHNPITGEVTELPIANLASALASVMAEIEPIKKQGFNPHFKYNFTRMEDLLAEVTPKLAKHGLLIIQSEVSHQIVESMLYATFEFTLMHRSGEVWSEKPRATGMARIANDRGTLDDKAMNKCHTAARKYFMLALFQIPSEGVDDADHGEAENKPQVDERQRPSQPAAQRGSISERAMAARQDPVPPVTFPPGTTPRRIEPVRGETPNTWADKYYRAVLSSTNTEAVLKWRAANEDLLSLLSEKSPELFHRTEEAAIAKQRAFSAQPVIDRAAAAKAARKPTPPLPRENIVGDHNAEDFRAQLDAEWATIDTVHALNESWRTRVEPIQSELFPPDLADLSVLWQAHATRIEQGAT